MGYRHFRWMGAVGVGLALFPQLGGAQVYQNVVLRNSFNPVGAGARGMGMGGAFIAVADDGTASSFNPAGLAQVRRTELALVGFGSATVSTVEGESGRLTPIPETTSHHGALDFAGLSVPFDVLGHKLTVEASYQRSVDLFGKGRASLSGNLEVPPELGVPGATQDFVLSVDSEQHGAYHTASLAAGFEVTSRLSLGAAVSYWISEWTAAGANSIDARLNVPGLPETDLIRISDQSFTQQQSFRGAGLSAGFLLKYPRVSLGGVARFPFTARFELDETVRTVEHVPVEVESVSGGTPQDRIHARLDWPWTSGLGIAIRPFKGFTIAADYTHAQWSQMILEDLPDGSFQTDPVTDSSGKPIPTHTDRNFFDLNPASHTDTRDTNGYRVGIEYLITTSKFVIPVRLGGFHDVSPVPDLEGARSIQGGALGTGLNFEWLKLDLAAEMRVSRGNFEALVLPDQSVVARPGSDKEKILETRLIASMILRFGGRGDDPVKRLFRYLFVGPKEEG